jgi:RimJ/RimL family protein N-acetyltransferase
MAPHGGAGGIRYVHRAAAGHHGAMEPPLITTPRLLLRPWRPEDAPAVTAACQDPESQRWLPLPSPYEERHGREYVERNSADRWVEDAAEGLAVTDATTGEVLASLGLHRGRHRDDDAIWEVGFWCAPWARGRGVTTEATLAGARWSFARHRVRRLEWFAAVGNHGSRRVAEKAGFTMEGTLRSFLIHRGERLDAWAGSLLPGDVA